MRELLSGAAIGIIPHPPKDDYFGTIDERHGSRTRFLFLGYEVQPNHPLLWSLYVFSPRQGIWDYAFKEVIVRKYQAIPKDADGKIPKDEYEKNKTTINDFGSIASRDNNLLMIFDTDHPWDIEKLEEELASTMGINPDLIERPDVREMVEYLCDGMIRAKPTKLNIWGDYKFLWHDYGYFADDNYLCVLGIEKATCSKVVGDYGRLVQYLQTKKNGK